MQTIKPAMPYKPYNPKEPKYISFKPNWWQKIIYSDEKKMEKELAMNNPKQAEFDKRIDNYDKAMLKYVANLKKYNEVELPKYSKDDDAYREELSNRAEAINKCFIDYSKKIATKYINQRIDAYLKKPITNRTKLNLSNFKFNADYFNPYDFVYQVIGKQNIQPESMKSDIMMDAAFRLYDAYGNYFYPPNLVLRDGSIIYTNINSLVNQQILKIIDSSGLNNLMDDYNKKILEASAKAGALDNSQLNSYVYTVSKTDWINCDRFVDNPNPVAVNISESDEAKVFVVCHDVNGYLPAYSFKNLYVANSIPKNSNITIVSVKLKDGKIFMATEKTKADSNEPHRLTYKECTVAQMKEQLKKIDSNT
jgi:hypothetical protein